MIKYLVKCKKSNRYIIDVEWDGVTYSKEPYFSKFYSFDTKQEAERMKISDSKVVAVHHVVKLNPSHGSYKWHFTPKKKYTVRCPNCGLGTLRPRATFQIAYTEYLQLISQIPCRSDSYKEVDI